MQGLALHALTAVILKWLPSSQHLIRSLAKCDQVLIVRWLPASGNPTISDIYVSADLIEIVEHAIQLGDAKLLALQMEKVEAYVRSRVAGHDEHDKRPWFLSGYLLSEQVYNAPF